MTTSPPLIVDRTDWVQHAAGRVDRGQWSAVIAAAGKGSRLGFDRPKILFPVAGRMILEWLLDLLLPSCQTVVLVLSPEGLPSIQPELERLAPGRCRVAIQPAPSGMGDAVDIGAGFVDTPHTAVLWGDQVALRPASVDAVLRLHQGPLAPDVTIPTVLRPEPYIHFERDEAGRIHRLLQAREGDAMPPAGESDTGFFCFRTTALRSLLGDLRNHPASHGGARGSATGEFNLLPVIPHAVRSGYRVLTPRVMDLEETVGINSPSDARRVEPFLRSRHA